MRNGTTGSGFSYEFDEIRANDMHVLDRVIIMASDRASPLEKAAALSALPRMLLGDGQAAALYEHLEKLHDGRVPPADLERELTEILGKN